MPQHSILAQTISENLVSGFSAPAFITEFSRLFVISMVASKKNLKRYMQKPVAQVSLMEMKFHTYLRKFWLIQENVIRSWVKRHFVKATKKHTSI